jgi:spore cortex formation protein SpoVR/YcgB (stage V sporulation)
MQPKPTTSKNSKEITPMVISDIKRRSEAGVNEYGVSLKSFNGRDALVDAYEEVLDMAQYLRQEIEERKNTYIIIDWINRDLFQTDTVTDADLQAMDDGLIGIIRMTKETPINNKWQALPKWNAPW